MVLKGREYTLRKLHSLIGIIPVGLFLVIHFSVNYAALNGPAAYDGAVSFMERLPFKLFLEVFFIGLPILYHAALGIHIALTSKIKLRSFGTFRNWMFIFQRITGIILLVFISWHVWETRILSGMGVVDVGFQMMVDIVTKPGMLAFYLIGIVSAVFHFANGLWSFLITWGITVSPKSQRVSTYVTMALFVAMSAIGVGIILSFLNTHPVSMLGGL